ncbi:MAG: hypothetical protein NPIRA04_31170 [Nitrospirales bacterium]|nr:MAG: hypothetical protein NPIRA04_31170 [Nitrospirales bacterium]
MNLQWLEKGIPQGYLDTCSRGVKMVPMSRLIAQSETRGFVNDRVQAYRILMNWIRYNL